MIRALLVAALAALAPLVALALVAPWIHGAFVAALLSYGVAALAIVLAVAAAPARQIAERRPALGVATVGALLSGVAVVLPPVASGLLGSLGVIACATVLGCAVGTRVQAAGHLLPVALLSAGVDIVSVGAPEGVTRHIVEHPALLQLLMVRAAVPPHRAPEPAIGFGDVAFAALYLSACTKFELSRARTLVALLAGLLAAWVVAVVAGVGGGIPALPFLGAMVVLAHPAARKVAPRDRTATWVAGSLLVGGILRVALR